MNTIGWAGLVVAALGAWAAEPLPSRSAGLTFDGVAATQRAFVVPALPGIGLAALSCVNQVLADNPVRAMHLPQQAEPDSLALLELEASRREPRYWLENMLVHHRFTWSEAAVALGWSEEEVKTRAAEFRIKPDASPPPTSDGKIRMLPYPGGRHPRIGFLEGALNPQRGTKVSLFPPWTNGGYVVLDLPEAIFSNLGLTYLAHTHIPTIWSQGGVAIENVDWVRAADGRLRSEWKLPNGITFGARVIPLAQGAEFELWLKNGTEAKLTELRTQVCLMLKGAPGFNEQNQERKEYAKPLVVVRAREADRYVLLAFQHCGRAWGNEQCPCIHSDPVLPDAAPGERVAVRGRLWFYEGSEVEVTKQWLRDSL